MDEEELIKWRDDLDETIGVLQAIINKMNQVIEGEITPEEYNEWVDQHEDLINTINY